MTSPKNISNRLKIYFATHKFLIVWQKKSQVMSKGIKQEVVKISKVNIKSNISCGVFCCVTSESTLKPNRCVLVPFA